MESALVMALWPGVYQFISINNYHTATQQIQPYCFAFYCIRINKLKINNYYLFRFFIQVLSLLIVFQELRLMIYSSIPSSTQRILKSLILTPQPTLTLLKVLFFQCYIFRSICIILRRHNYSLVDVNQAICAWSFQSKNLTRNIQSALCKLYENLRKQR